MMISADFQSTARDALKFREGNSIGHLIAKQEIGHT